MTDQLEHASRSDAAEAERQAVHGADSNPQSYFGGKCVWFLPSRYGTGFRPSLHVYGEDIGEVWDRDGYQTLRGVALLPTKREFRTLGGLILIVERLKAQGVLFLTERQTRIYLDTEVAYGIWRFGGCAPTYVPEGFSVRRPSLSERLSWLIKAPPTPVDDELARRELTYPQDCDFEEFDPAH